MKRRRRRSLTKTRKWSTCRCRWTPGYSMCWGSDHGERQSRSSWTCSTLGIGCARSTCLPGGAQSGLALPVFPKALPKPCLCGALTDSALALMGPGLGGRRPSSLPRHVHSPGH